MYNMLVLGSNSMTSFITPQKKMSAHQEPTETINEIVRYYPSAITTRLNAAHYP